MNHRKLTALLLVLGASMFGACSGEKPAQDYAVVGKVTPAPNLAASLRRMVQAGYDVRVVMTARTSPKVEDVILQRRWIKGTLPLAFGLGKGRGSRLKTKYSSVYLTVLVDFLVPQTGRLAKSYVGWTPEPVAIGSDDVTVFLSHELEDESAKSLRNYPEGGWYNWEVREEAVPPGVSGSSRGPVVFAGTVDVKPESARMQLRGVNLMVLARERKDRGFPELIKPVELPIYPLRFALRQGDRQAGGDEDITTPKFVEAIIDLDGNVETKEDRYRAVTSEQVKPGTKDLHLVIDVSQLMEKVNQARAGASAPSDHASGMRKPVESGRVLVSGVVELPKNLEPKVQPGSTLFLSLRDEQGKLLMVLQPVASPEFPYAYKITEGSGVMGAGVPDAKAKVRVKALLSNRGAMAKAKDGALIAVSKPVEQGTTGLTLRLSDKD
ncbi:MAG TPA: hypothetical protein ENK43_12040 [Planctomycetes bacterium]|nr:hypothetical protein [Planctomycetota bacterium]